MKYDAKLLGKLSLIFFGLLFLLCLFLGKEEEERRVPEGEGISVEDVEILLEALEVPADFLREEADGFDLTYGQYIQIYEQVNGETLGLPDFGGIYGQEDPFLKEHWYEAYRILLAHLDTESSIWETTVFVLQINPERREAYTESGAMKGAYQYCSADFEDNVFQEMRVYVQGERLLTIVEVMPEEHYLGNVWVMETGGGVLDCFYHQVAFRADMAEGGSGMPAREQVADLTFRDGRVVKARGHADKVHGKLLRLSGEELEIEGHGVYQISEDMEIYKLYGSMETLRPGDLKIGYADTDFVVEKNRVRACLVSRAEQADTIRVLLKNTASGGSCHQAVELQVDGERVRIEAGDMEVGERRRYQSANLTDKILVEMEGSTRADNAYRGLLECYRTEEGIVLINELPLEEYLYAVVPSEMPASYPAEALKAQAVCARTYSYRYILHAGLPQFGAHVDDTTAYQVYHNIAENAASTMAVKETDGMLLLYQGEPAENYYYSTSCGAGTDAGIWKGPKADLAYLSARRMRRDSVGPAAAESMEGRETAPKEVTAEMLSEEANFRAFIAAPQSGDLEKEEPWYRWSYQVEEIEEEAFFARLRERYQAAPEAVLTKAAGGYYVSEPIEKTGRLRDLSIVKRRAGGVAEELLVETDKGVFKVVSEYNIRCVLCDGKSEAVRQDHSTTVPKTLLPSGFFVLDAFKSGENVVGYTLTGGGYGHGVGMSQNGAKALGEMGVSCEQILTMYYPGCMLGKADTSEEADTLGKSGVLEETGAPEKQ